MTPKTYHWYRVLTQQTYGAIVCDEHGVIISTGGALNWAKGLHLDTFRAWVRSRNGEIEYLASHPVEPGPVEPGPVESEVKHG